MSAPLADANATPFLGPAVSPRSAAAPTDEEAVGVLLPPFPRAAATAGAVDAPALLDAPVAAADLEEATEPDAWEGFAMAGPEAGELGPSAPPDAGEPDAETVERGPSLPALSLVADEPDVEDEALDLSPEEGDQKAAEIAAAWPEETVAGGSDAPITDEAAAAGIGDAAPTEAEPESLPWLDGMEADGAEPAEEPVAMGDEEDLETPDWEWPEEPTDSTAALGFLEPGVLPWIDPEVEALSDRGPGAEPTSSGSEVAGSTERGAGGPEPGVPATSPGSGLAPLAPVALPVPPAGGERRPALTDVAARLEQIANSLRDGSASELLGPRAGSDPLQILITGYAIGYAEAIRGAAQEQRAKEEGEPGSG